MSEPHSPGHRTMLVDYHVHTPYCGHALGRTIDYVKRAVECGLGQIAFTDHLYRYYLTPAQRERFADWGMDEAALERYVTELHSLRAEFAGVIDIKFGLEVDFVRGTEQHAASLIARYPFDFIIGSVHCLPSVGWHHLVRYVNRDPAALYKEYFACARDALACGVFDSLAHLDFAWRNMAWPAQLSNALLAEIRSVVDTAATHRHAMEINANGFLWSTLLKPGMVNPFEEMVRHIAKAGVAVTVGSDAHTPQSVAGAIPEIAQYLARHGITSAATFDKRSRHLVTLSRPEPH